MRSFFIYRDDIHILLCSYFGQPGTKYDFEAMDGHQLAAKSEELTKAQQGMKKKVNPKVMSMIDRCVSANTCVSY